MRNRRGKLSPVRITSRTVKRGVPPPNWREESPQTGGEKRFPQKRRVETLVGKRIKEGLLEETPRRARSLGSAGLG